MTPSQSPPLLSAQATAGLTIHNLHELTLSDGLPVERGGKTYRYKTVRLRAVAVKDAQWAVCNAERVVVVDGAPRLLMSEQVYQLGMTLRHIASLSSPGMPEILTEDLTLAHIGELSTHDLMLLEQRSLLVEMAEQRRYGLITDEQFSKLLSPAAPKETPSPPLPTGAAATLGADAAAPGDGPQMLSE